MRRHARHARSPAVLFGVVVLLLIPAGGDRSAAGRADGPQPDGRLLTPGLAETLVTVGPRTRPILTQPATRHARPDLPGLPPAATLLAPALPFAWAAAASVRRGHRLVGTRPTAPRGPPAFRTA